jgi:hypothetical protein
VLGLFLITHTLSLSHYPSGYFPILPTDYVPDSSPPVPIKWFLDRNSSSLIVIFSEPIDLIDCSGLHLQSQSINVTVETCLPAYFELGTKLLLDLSLSHFSTLTDRQRMEAILATRPGELWMRIDNGTVSDVVSERNLIASWLAAESSPGERHRPLSASPRH